MTAEIAPALTEDEIEEKTESLFEEILEDAVDIQNRRVLTNEDVFSLIEGTFYEEHPISILHHNPNAQLSNAEVWSLDTLEDAAEYMARKTLANELYQMIWTCFETENEYVDYNPSEGNLVVTRSAEV